MMMMVRASDNHHVYFTELRPTHTLQLYAWKQAEIHHRTHNLRLGTKYIGPYTLPKNWEPT